ncbi:MAG: hypothetical protein PHD20_02855 [Clostridia bacterium]|nr:hypothetical protein [Clostridia bacterium]
MELTNTQWSNLFHDMEQQSKKQADSMNEKYISLGEIDDPSEMLSDIHVKLSDIQGIGKTNWLKSTITGRFSQVGDCTLDNLYDAGKIIEHDYYSNSYDPEYRKYSSLSKEEKILYRINNQGVSKQLAKELVYDEFGYSWEHSFEYKITEVIGNTLDDSKEEQTYQLYIDADTEQEAQEKLSSELRKEGQTVCTFTKFPEGYKASIGEMLTGGKFPRYKKYVVSVLVELINS